jgi:hypothetical protein
VTRSSNPEDGQPDPAGRIVFGEVTRQDNVLPVAPGHGQLVAPLYAVDPDG